MKSPRTSLDRAQYLSRGYVRDNVSFSSGDPKVGSDKGLDEWWFNGSDNQADVSA